MTRAFPAWLLCVGVTVACAAPPSAPAAASATPGSATDVVELSATDIRDRLTSGALTSRALTQAYLDRITAIDDAGPKLDAVIELNPSALQVADALDAERRSGKVRSALHGIPILIKDNIDIAGLVNSAGSLALADHRPAQDAFIVERLRAAGAVILGTGVCVRARTTHSSACEARISTDAYALGRGFCLTDLDPSWQGRL